MSRVNLAKFVIPNLTCSSESTTAESVVLLCAQLAVGIIGMCLATLIRKLECAIIAIKSGWLIRLAPII